MNAEDRCVILEMELAQLRAKLASIEAWKDDVIAQAAAHAAEDRRRDEQPELRTPEDWRRTGVSDLARTVLDKP